MRSRQISRRTLLASGLAAASARFAPLAAQERTTITFANWAAAEGATRPGIEQVIAAFEAANPGISVRSEAIGFSDIARQLVLRVRAGNPPDVAQLAGNDTLTVAATGGLKPLGPLAGPELLANLRPGATTGLERNGQLIAFPWNLAPAGFWYAKRVMERAGLDPNQPPRTIDALTPALAAIKRTQPNVIPIGLDTTNRAFAMSSNWPWMRAFGATPLADDGSAHADTAEMRAYLEWMRSLARNQYLDPGRRIGEFRPMIAQDQVGFLWDQVLVQGVIQTTNHMPDEEFYRSYGVTVMPTGPSGGSYSFEGGHQLAVFQASRAAEAAWKFVRFLVTDPMAISVYTINTNRSLPPLARVGDPQIETQLATPVFRTFLDTIVPTIAPQPYGARFAAASTAVMAGVQQAVTGTDPIADIAAEIQRQLARQ